MAIGNNRGVRSLTFTSGVAANMSIAFNDLTTGARNLGLGASIGNASITVNTNSDITLGTGIGTVYGGLILGSDLTVTQNGSGLLSINRQISGGFGITKEGVGTLRIGAANANSFTGALIVNQGTLIANTTQGATGDFNTASGITLGGGKLEIQTSSGLDKTINPNLTVSSASTLAYKNTTDTTQTLTLQTGTMALNANLTVENTSTGTALNNLINNTRAMTGSGSLIVTTYNNISAISNSFTPGRVQLSGDNSNWSGDLVIAKGTGQLSGNSTSSGTGNIVIGTSSDSFGAGLATNVSANTTWSNNIQVTSGGFRGIRHVGGGASDIAFTGTMTLNGNLTVGYSQDSGRTFTLGGDKSGVGGLTFTNYGGDSGGYAVVGGANTYLGSTNVTSGALLLNGSATSNITVDGTSRFGGDGSTTGNLTFSSVCTLRVLTHRQLQRRWHAQPRQ